MNLYRSVADHIFFCALLVSALWFYAGSHYRGEAHRTAAIVWRVVAFVALVAFCLFAVMAKGWLSLGIVVASVLFDLWLMTRRRGGGA